MAFSCISGKWITKFSILTFDRTETQILTVELKNVCQENVANLYVIWFDGIPEVFLASALASLFIEPESMLPAIVVGSNESNQLFQGL